MNILPDTTKTSGEETLLKSIVLQCMADYFKAHKYLETKSKYGQHYRYYKSLKEECRDWVEKMSGTFNLCAEAMSQSNEILQEMMLVVMDKIDRGEKTHFTDRHKRRRHCSDTLT
jgi:hypothetical protein